MKSLIKFVLITAVLSAPLVSFAQSNTSNSRAQVRNELVRVENAGYRPVAEDASYPAKIQAAEARASENRTVDYGAVPGATSESGRAAKRADPQSVFFGQ